MALPYDSWASQINGIALNVHFYILELNDFGSQGLNYMPFTISGQVQNLLYMPFLKKSDLGKAVHEHEFDQKYYGTAKIDATSPDQLANPAPKVFKIYGDTTTIEPKKLGSFKRYPSNFGKKPTRDWRNESKLYQFPYHFCTINDFINRPLVVKNEYIPPTKSNDVEVYVYQPLTMTGGYTIFIKGYKGDKSNVGANEGMLANAGLDLPTSSSEYAQFMATSKAQFIAQNEAGNRNEWTNFSRGALSFATGAFQATLGAVAMGASGGTATMMGAGTMVGAGVLTAGQGLMDMIQSGVTETNRIENSQALMSDLMSAPRNVTMSSSDILSSMSRNNKHVVVNRYMPSNYYKQKLADYWHLYGYKQNKLMTPNTKSRKYWNYIKTMNANIESSKIDKQEIEIIKAIYNKGIRFWHQGAGEMHKYDKDNVEVYNA